MIFKQIKQIYEIKLIEEKINKTNIKVDIKEELGIHPFTYSKLKAVSSMYDIKSLEEILLDFDEYDENSKTGKVDIVIGLKQIILRI